MRRAPGHGHLRVLHIAVPQGAGRCGGCAHGMKLVDPHTHDLARMPSRQVRQPFRCPRIDGIEQANRLEEVSIIPGRQDSM